MSVEQTNPRLDRVGFTHDAYIYVLKCRREADSETYYYVGQTTDLEERLKDHVDNHGDFAGPMPAERGGDVIVPREKTRFEVASVEELDGVTRSRECTSAQEGGFTHRLRELERKKAYEVAREYETTNVLGGVSG